jgi:hypothetical protein
MDPVTLAGLAMAALAPYIAKVGEEVATKVGDAAFDHAQRLYSAIHARFVKEPDGGKASKQLEEFKQDPDVANTVQTKLVRMLQDDPTFAQTLTQIVQSGPKQNLTVRGSSSAKDTDISNATSSGTQEALVEDHSTIEGTRLRIGPKEN